VDGFGDDFVDFFGGKPVDKFVDFVDFLTGIPIFLSN